MLRKALATLPPTLDQTYDRILSAISEEDFDYAIRILQWLTFSARPLSIEEVAEIVAIDGDRDPAFNQDEVLEDPLEVYFDFKSL
jgi:DNA-binding transcriptional LysR family regulator